MTFHTPRVIERPRRRFSRGLLARPRVGPRSFPQTPGYIPGYRLPPVPANVCRSVSRCSAAQCSAMQRSATQCNAPPPLLLLHTKRKRVRGGSRARLNRFPPPLKNAPPSAIIILIDTQARPPRLSFSRNRALTLARAFARCRRYALMAADRPGSAWQAAHSGPGERKTRASERVCAYYLRLLGDRRRRIPRRTRARGCGRSRVYTTARDTRAFSAESTAGAGADEGEARVTM